MQVFAFVIKLHQRDVLMFYTVFQCFTSCWIHLQRNRIETGVLDTFSKIFVILAFFDKNQPISFDKVRFDKKMLQHQ